ncbi:hypothetical protein ACWC0A_38010 [Streptomyces scopuliridis]
MACSPGPPERGSGVAQGPGRSTPTCTAVAELADPGARVSTRDEVLTAYVLEWPPHHRLMCPP